jgi:Asp-tRNA(Asn)/Glu-tRNA(Gln) amidotransferase A subunit family amidase
LHSQRKQSERASKIAKLPEPYLSPLSPQERTILGKPI